MKKLLIIGDTDGLIGFINPLDPHNQKAKSILDYLQHYEALLAFPTTTVAEAITTMQRKYNNPDLAEQIAILYRTKQLSVFTVDEMILEQAAVLFNPHGSKKNTFFDAIVAAVAKQQHADAIFSFDEWYKKIGLTLASDLISS